MVSHRLLGIANRGQVVDAVPLEQQCGIREQAIACLGGQIEAEGGQPAIERRALLMRSFAVPADPRRASVRALEPHEQQRHRRGRHPLYAPRLADGFGTVLIEFLLHLLRQATHLA
jgi:hypothetical protein